LEHGPAGGDELNLVQRGNNYGWPVRSEGDNYNGTPIPDHSPDDGFTKPAIEWTPVIAPGDFLFYSGDMFADWRGDALIANLKEQNIVRVDMDGTTATEAARYEFGERLREIVQGPDGALYVLEDGKNGRLRKLTPAG
ncbi:MAG: PQQ-dependent sugar dehydrogenase, partial [Alteriqipengyuania sp.]